MLPAGGRAQAFNVGQSRWPATSKKTPGYEIGPYNFSVLRDMIGLRVGSTAGWLMEVTIVRGTRVTCERHAGPRWRRLLAFGCVAGPFVVIMVLNIFYGELISPALYQNSATLAFQYAPAAPAVAAAAVDEKAAAAKPGAATAGPDAMMFLPARDYAGRVAYAIASAFLVFVALATFVFSAALIFQSRKWPGVIVAVIIWMVVSWSVAVKFSNVHGRYLVVRDLFNAADTFPGLAPFVTLSHGRPLPTGQLMENLIFDNTVIALIPVGMLLTALALLTWSPPEPLTEAALIARRLLLRCLLWLASGSFVMGVMCNKALVEWPLTLIKAGEAVALTPIADSLVLQFGALGTGAILAAFAPAITAWMLDVHALRQSAQSGDGQRTDTLQFATSTTITSIVAVVAPLLASPVVDSVKSIVGALSK